MRPENRVQKRHGSKRGQPRCYNIPLNMQFLLAYNRGHFLLTRNIASSQRETAEKEMSRVPGVQCSTQAVCVCGAASAWLPLANFRDVASATVPSPPPTQNRRHAHRHGRHGRRQRCRRCRPPQSPPPLWPLHCHHRKLHCITQFNSIAWPET